MFRSWIEPDRVIIVHRSEVGSLPIQNNDVCFFSPARENRFYLLRPKTSALPVVASLTTVLASIMDGSFLTILVNFGSSIHFRNKRSGYYCWHIHQFLNQRECRALKTQEPVQTPEASFMLLSGQWAILTFFALTRKNSSGEIHTQCAAMVSPSSTPILRRCLTGSPIANHHFPYLSFRFSKVCQQRNAMIITHLTCFL